MAESKAASPTTRTLRKRRRDKARELPDLEDFLRNPKKHKPPAGIAEGMNPDLSFGWTWEVHPRELQPSLWTDNPRVWVEEYTGGGFSFGAPPLHLYTVDGVPYRADEYWDERNNAGLIQQLRIPGEYEYSLDDVD